MARIYLGGVLSGFIAPTPITLGQLVRGFRKQHGWTQAQLAERAGLLPKTVSAIECGRGQVLLANVMRCLSALEVELSLEPRPAVGTGPQPHADPSGKPARHGTKAPTRVSPPEQPRRAFARSKALQEKW